MQFHFTEIKPVSYKYNQNKQLFRYFVGRLCKASGTKLNYEVKVANAEAKDFFLQMGLQTNVFELEDGHIMDFVWWLCCWLDLTGKRWQLCYDDKVEVLEQDVEHFQAQQAEYVLDLEARLEGMFQKQKMGGIYNTFLIFLITKLCHIRACID